MSTRSFGDHAAGQHHVVIVRARHCAGRPGSSIQLFHTRGAVGPQEGYRTAVDRQPVFLDRTSALQGCIPELVFHELVMSLEHMREAVAVDPAWPLQRLSARRTARC